MEHWQFQMTTEAPGAAIASSTAGRLEHVKFQVSRRWLAGEPPLRPCPLMSTRERPADRGRRLARAAIARLAEDHRRARVGAGLSLRAVAQAVGVSHSHVRRFEHGLLKSPSVAFMAASCSVVGLELGIRAYPAGDPVRDAPQNRLLDRLEALAHSSVGMEREVGLPIERDLRAWDAVVCGTDWEAHVEAETRIDDGQAMARRLALKVRDGGAELVILLVADTRGNRAALAAIRAGLRVALPHDTREILAALRAGRRPPGSGIVIL